MHAVTCDGPQLWEVLLGFQGGSLRCGTSDLAPVAPLCPRQIASGLEAPVARGYLKGRWDAGSSSVCTKSQLPRDTLAYPHPPQIQPVSVSGPAQLLNGCLQQKPVQCSFLCWKIDSHPKRRLSLKKQDTKAELTDTGLSSHKFQMFCKSQESKLPGGK